MSALRRPVFGLFNVTLPEVFHKPIPLPMVGYMKEILFSPLPGFSAPTVKVKKRIQTKKVNKDIDVGKPALKAKAGQFLIEGLIECGKKSRFMIADKEFDIDANTWIIGNVEYGAFARVKGVAQGEKKIATQLVILRGAPANEG